MRRTKTREEKIRTQKRHDELGGFKVDPAWIKKTKPANEQPKLSTEGVVYLKSDLTKTFVLTMLVLAFELALWQWLKG